MNTKNSLIFLALVLLFSCGQEQSKDFDDNGNLNKNAEIDTAGSAAEEIILKTQLQEYLTAFSGGNLDKVFYYIYPNALKYLIQQYPERYPNMGAAKDSFSSPILKLKKIMKQNPDYRMDFEIGELTKKIKYKTAKLYMVNMYGSLKINLKTQAVKEEVIGISYDDGDNWKFLNNDSEETNGILNMEFPQSAISELLSKE